MRNFSWNCFRVTGSIDAYLLFKDLEALTGGLDNERERVEDEEEEPPA
ncbi:YqzL family protein [Risungbinella massiliensis]|nr:YqzL family protein [Risungbinella massiliensis]